MPDIINKSKDLPVESPSFVEQAPGNCLIRYRNEYVVEDVYGTRVTFNTDDIEANRRYAENYQALLSANGIASQLFHVRHILFREPLTFCLAQTKPHHPAGAESEGRDHVKP